MKQIRVALVALLLFTLLAGAIYGAYPTVTKLAIIATLGLGFVLLVNRFIEPRWGLSDGQQRTENRLRTPFIVSVFVSIGLFSIGEDGFENLSGSLTMRLVGVILIAAIASLGTNWVKGK